MRPTFLTLFCTTLIACDRSKDTGTDCSDPPTYDNWTQGFLDGKCQSCHASTSPNRNGAPPSVAFDTRAMADQWRDRIEVTVFEEGSMPPSGGVTSTEKVLLEQWLYCTE